VYVIDDHVITMAVTLTKISMIIKMMRLIKELEGTRNVFEMILVPAIIKLEPKWMMRTCR